MLQFNSFWKRLGVGGRFRWILHPTFLRISYFQDHIMMIFTNINKFHEFWWVFEFRNDIYKNEPKCEESQAGRPTPVELCRATLWFMVLSTRTSQPKGVSCKNHKLRLKGLNQVKLGPIAVTNQRIKTQADLRSDVQLVINVIEQRRPKTSQSHADWPRWGRLVSNYLRSSQATTTDLRRESGASTRRRWEIRGTPGRPA